MGKEVRNNPGFPGAQTGVRRGDPGSSSHRAAGLTDIPGMVPGLLGWWSGGGLGKRKDCKERGGKPKLVRTSKTIYLDKWPGTSQGPLCRQSRAFLDLLIVKVDSAWKTPLTSGWPL